MKKVFLAILYLCNLGVIIGFWWNNSGPLVASGDTSSVFIGIGRLIGLLGEFLILTQLVLIGRIRFVEQLFGFDKLNRVHRLIGYSWLFLIAFHPLFLTIGYGLSNDISLVTQFVDFLNNWLYVSYALAGLLLFIGVIIVSVSIIRRKIKYETWYFTHLLIYLAIGLIFTHQIQSGDIKSDQRFYYYWFALNFTIFGLVLLYRWIRPLYLAWKFQFKIHKIVQENNVVTSVYITGRNLQQYQFEAGQYAHVTFLARGMWYTHPFSFSSAPGTNFLRLSIKRVGDFTSQVNALREGTRIIIDGPFGIFTERSAKTKKFLFIAAGIGITPIYSLIESLSKKKADMILLYGNKTLADAPFSTELFKLNVRVHHILSQETSPGDEHGRIDKEKIARLVSDVKERDVYVCGPEAMIEDTRTMLIELGVPHKQIHFERFGY